MSRFSRAVAVAAALALLAAGAAVAATPLSGFTSPSSLDGLAIRSDSLADTLDAPEPESEWDGRARGTMGVARLEIGDGEKRPIYPFYLSINYRLSSNTSRERPSTLRLGFGGEVGIFYLYPYIMLGPELRYGDLYLEAHGGAAFIFLIGAEAAVGTGGAIGGLSAGWIIGSPEIVHLELQAGADLINLLGGPKSTTAMPHVTIAFRF